ncbi:MAG: U32 family peptidase [Candidatus Omnitrophica bacterium]|nr:U32 family peptidase [Candidatus Omnitrophota bacterium]
MKILMPLNPTDNIDILIKGGADEFYCGFIPPESKNTYVNILTEYENNDFTTIEELKNKADIIHSYGKKIFVVLNFQYYTEAFLEILLSTIEKLNELPIDAFILSDLGLITQVRVRFPEIEVHLSTVTGAFNTYALRFFQDLGVTRIVLPDHLNNDEIAALTQHAPKMQLEIFVMNNRCIHLECLCRFHHWQKGQPHPAPSSLSRTTLGHIKRILRQFPHKILGLLFNNPVIKKVFENILNQTRDLHGCRLPFDVSPLNLPATRERIQKAQELERYFGPFHVFMRYPPCGACTLYRAWHQGIDVFKIDGRFNPFSKKLKDLRFIIECAGFLAQAKDEKEFIVFCKNRFKKIFGHRCTHEQCYDLNIWIQN